MGIVELIQALELGNKTAIMRLKYKSHEGVVYFKKGRIVHAEVGKIKGEKAFYLMLNWNEGTFQIEFTEHNIVETITVSNQGLLMEGLRRIDEWKQLQEIIPPLDTVLVIDSQAILNEHPEQFPSKVEGILAEFDGKKSILDVVESLDIDEIEALKTISQLYFQGFLVESTKPSDERKVTYYYPARGAQNVEKPSASRDSRTWASEAEEFLSRSSKEGEDTTFLQPPVEEEVSVVSPEVEERKIPKAEPAEKQVESDKVIYLKSVQEQKSKTVSIPEPGPVIPPISLTEPPKQPKIERQMVAISSAEVKSSSAKKVIVAVTAAIILTVPAVFFSVPALREKALSIFKKDASINVSRAEELVNAGRFEEAKKILDELIKKGTGNPVVYYLLAKANRGIPGNETAVIDALFSAVRVDPENVKYRMELAQLLMEKGRFDDAERVLKESGSIHNDVSALLMLAKVQEKLERTTDAISTFKRVLSLENGNVDAKVSIARLALKMNDYATIVDALSGVNSALLSEGQGIEIEYLLGRAMEGQGKKTEALEFYRKVIARSPNYLDTAVRVRSLEDELKPTRQARTPEVKKPSVENQFDTAMKRGRDYYKKGELGKAIEQFQLASKLNPRSDSALVELGTALFDTGRDIDAILKLTQAITINPANSRALLLLGNIYYARGDNDKAITYYKKFLEIAPDSPFAPEVRTILGRLKGG